jgi:hypothetical protein
MEAVVLHPVLFGNGLLTAVPCPPDLLVSIVLVNRLRSSTLPATDERRIAAYQLLERVLSFEVEIWEEEVNSTDGHTQQSSSASTVHTDNAVAWNWQLIAHIYQSAVALYCISALFDMEKDTAYTYKSTKFSIGLRISLAQIQQIHRDALLHDLKAVSSGESPQLRKFTLWPLVIAAIELRPDDHTSESFIVGELGWISKAVGIRSPLMAGYFLNKFWRLPGARGKSGPKNWAELFDEPYVFAL